MAAAGRARVCKGQCLSHWRWVDMSSRCSQPDPLALFTWQLRTASLQRTLIPKLAPARFRPLHTSMRRRRAHLDELSRVGPGGIQAPQRRRQPSIRERHSKGLRGTYWPLNSEGKLYRASPPGTACGSPQKKIVRRSWHGAEQGARVVGAKETGGRGEGGVRVGGAKERTMCSGARNQSRVRSYGRFSGSGEPSHRPPPSTK